MGTLLSLLSERPTISEDGYPINWLGIGDGVLYALLGYVVTFLGIALLILVVWLCGLIIKKVTGKSSRKKTAETVPATVPASEDVGEEVRVAIIAAIAAYYASENSTCEFKVRRIKRI